jgi:hypothetical protein
MIVLLQQVFHYYQSGMMEEHIYNRPLIMIFLQNKQQTIGSMKINKKKTFRDKTHLEKTKIRVIHLKDKYFSICLFQLYRLLFRLNHHHLRRF